MKLLCAFMLVLAVTTAKPTSERHHGGSGPVSHSQSAHVSNMVGHCTLKDFTYSTVKCQRMFFLSFRKDKTTPCGVRFQLFTKCYINQFSQCYKNILSGKELDKLTTTYKSAIEQSKKMMCSNKEIDISHFVKDIPVMEGCPKHTLQDLINCAKPWYHMFIEDRGNPKLCYKYQKNRECAKRVIMRCKVGFPGMKWIFNKTLNPFCDKKQLVSHMTH